jgi:Concanavalin A-like lectin/glucanases superfamily/Type I phosphodiesterase / nucleotide pyrophosphatase
MASLTNANAGTLTNDLVAHFTFDNVLTDASGRANHGTAVGGPGFAAGVIGPGSLSFSSAADGTSFNYVTLGVRPDLSFGATNDYTICVWARLATWSGDPAFISNKNWVSGSNPGYVLATGEDGRLQWNFKEVDPNTRKDYDGPGGTFVAGGGWRHLAVSFDRGGNALAYVDGVLVDTRSLGTTSTTVDSGLPTNLGQDGTGTYTDGGTVSVNGLIDDLGIWRRVLGASEISRIFTAGLGGTNLSNVADPVNTNCIGHWVFAASNITGQVVRDLAGTRDGTIVGTKTFYQSNGVEALWLDGATSIQLATSIAGSSLPVRDLSVEAWVGLNSGTTWGGILGAFQDNGGAEQGWVLGYDNSRFNFALSSTGADDGDGLLTYLNADSTYLLQRWHHVVGTYEGTRQRIYVNGQLAGTSAIQSNKINYAASAPYDIGAYHDDNEFFRLNGWIKEVKLYNVALSSNEVAASFQASSNIISLPLTPPVLPSCTNAVPRTNSPFGDKRVLVIGIDGARVDSLLASNTPNLDTLAANGAASFAAQCSLGQPTVSGPGWSSLLTGVWANKHSVSNNSFTTPNYANYPHVFARIRQAQPLAYLASIVHWSPINTEILTNENFKLTGLTDSQVAEQAACHILAAGPDVLFLHFDDMDAAGHAGGYDPGNASYLAAFNLLDGRIGTVLQAVNSRAAQFGERWLVCVVSDHGGTSGGGHGGLSPEELTVPFFLSGGDAIQGTLSPAPLNVHLVPTILTYLGLEINPAWNLDGQVVGIRTALRISREGSGVVIRWQGPGILQEAASLAGPWNGKPDAVSPRTNSLPTGTKFYRLNY